MKTNQSRLILSFDLFVLFFLIKEEKNSNKRTQT